MTPLGPAVRLQEFVGMACGELILFITEPTICANPQARQHLARQAAQAGNVSAACSHLSTFINEVDALSHAAIRSEGRAIVRLNAQHFLCTHCGG
jgi:hypothetical protein